MARKATDDEFVDLYSLMDLPPDAEATVIRKRMNELYLEAQQNLDHRNVKKRLQYQQMYELYLPQARHLLLDPARRAEYDRYLQAYHSGHLPPPPPEASEEEPADTSTEVSTGGASSETSFHFDDTEVLEAQEPVDLEKQAAEREHLWARWKTGLEHVLSDENPAAESETGSEYAAGEYTDYDNTEYAEYDGSEYAEGDYNQEYTADGQAADTQFDFGGAAPGVTPPLAPYTPPRPAASAPAARQAPRRAPVADPTAIDLSDPAKVKEIEHQREVRRYALIKQAAQSAGLVWGWGAGTAFFFFSCLLFYILDEYLTRTKNHPIDRSIFNGLMLIGITLLSVLVGWIASSSARQRIIDELSHLALPDLVRRTRGK